MKIRESVRASRAATRRTAARSIVVPHMKQLGAPADVTVLDVVDGPVEFVDTRNNKRVGKVHLKPAHTVVAGVAFGRPYQAPFTVR